MRVQKPTLGTAMSGAAPVPDDLSPQLPIPIVSADSAASAPATAAAPVPPRAAVAILGSMIFLILALMGVLVQTTRAERPSAPEAAIVLS